MSEKSFWAQYKTAQWQQKSAAIKARDGWKCTWCSEVRNALQAHHLYYVPGKAPWDYPDDALITVCGPCHDRITAASKKASEKIRRMHPGDAEMAADEIGDLTPYVIREMFGALTLVVSPELVEAAIRESQKYGLSRDADGRCRYGGNDITYIIEHLAESMRRYCAKDGQ